MLLYIRANFLHECWCTCLNSRTQVSQDPCGNRERITRTIPCIETKPANMRELTERDAPRPPPGIENIVIIDNVPVVPESKVPKLTSVISKVLSASGEVVRIELPLDESSKKTQGFAFVEFRTKEQALEAEHQCNGAIVPCFGFCLFFIALAIGTILSKLSEYLGNLFFFRVSAGQETRIRHQQYVGIRQNYGHPRKLGSSTRKGFRR